LERERWDHELSDTYARVLRGLIAVAGQRERAEDALQDALLAALEPGVIARIDRADAWLYTVGVRKLRRAVWRRRLDVLLRPSAAAYPAPGLERIEATEILRDLTPRQRELVIARFYLDLSFKEIAEHFGISVGAATSTVTQAFGRIRAQRRKIGEHEWTSAR
jgi:RNA polymerase sigma factor (sigma-70 family)